MGTEEEISSPHALLLTLYKRGGLDYHPHLILVDRLSPMAGSSHDILLARLI